MNKLYVALLGAFALAAVPALSGCETDTATTGVDADGDGAADDAVVLNADSVDMVDMNADADSLEAGLDEAGTELGEAADSAGAAIGRGADAIGDAVDENVDLGDNAEQQGN